MQNWLFLKSTSDIGAPGPLRAPTVHHEIEYPVELVFEFKISGLIYPLQAANRMGFSITVSFLYFLKM